MATYLAFAPAGATPDRDVERMTVVKDGFSWPALIFALPWAVYHRLWWVTLGLVVAMVGLLVLAETLGGEIAWPAFAAFALLFALEANALRRWTIHRAGFEPVALVEARDAEDAEAKAIAKWVGGRRSRAIVAPVSAAAAATPAAPGGTGGPVLGLGDGDVIGSHPLPGARP